MNLGSMGTRAHDRYRLPRLIEKIRISLRFWRRYSDFKRGPQLKDPRGWRSIRCAWV